jgi:hypothetical protein
VLANYYGSTMVRAEAAISTDIFLLRIYPGYVYIFRHLNIVLCGCIYVTNMRKREVIVAANVPEARY